MFTAQRPYSTFSQKMSSKCTEFQLAIVFSPPSHLFFGYLQYLLKCLERVVGPVRVLLLVPQVDVRGQEDPERVGSVDQLLRGHREVFLKDNDNVRSCLCSVLSFLNAKQCRGPGVAKVVV